MLQFACCIITAILAIILTLARFQIRWLNKRYEVSRWLVAASMAALAFHFFLQMTHGLRAHNDNVGAAVNILFYTPIASLISFSVYNVVCSRATGRKRFMLVCLGIYLVISGVFSISSMLLGSLDVGDALYVMMALFVINLVYCIAVTSMEIRHHRKIMEENSGADLLPYDSYTGACYILMAASAMVLTVAIMYRPLLLIFGPFMLFSLIVYTMSYIGYGYNVTPSDFLLEEVDEESPIEEADEATAVGTEEIVNEVEPDDKKSRHNRSMEDIEKTLDEWCEMRGYRDSTANLISICQKMNVPKEDLSFYFEKHLKTTFRVWLSDIRFNAAKQMLSKNPTFNNDTVSTECGFSSHAHLYKIFKAKTGLTPRQWVDSL